MVRVRSQTLLDAIEQLENHDIKLAQPVKDRFYLQPDGDDMNR